MVQKRFESLKKIDDINNSKTILLISDLSRLLWFSCTDRVFVGMFEMSVPENSRYWNLSRNKQRTYAEIYSAIFPLPFCNCNERRLKKIQNFQGFSK